MFQVMVDGRNCKNLYEIFNKFCILFWQQSFLENKGLETWISPKMNIFYNLLDFPMDFSIYFDMTTMSH